MVYVRCEVNEPYKAFYYQRKYAVKMFIYFLVIYNSMAAIAFPYSIILDFRAKRDLTEGTETAKSNYKLVSAKASYIGTFTDLVKVTYNCDRFQLCLCFTDNQK